MKSKGVVSNLSKLLLLAALTVVATAPAKADSIKFFSGTTGYSGPFSGAGTVYNAIQNNPTACPGGGSACAGGPDIISPSQTFSGGITATANSMVWNDLEPPFGGLGVGVGTPPSADQIEPGDVLTIHFSVPTTLRGVATLFDAGHTPFGPGFPDGSSITAANTFLLNGVVTAFGAANMALLSTGFLTDFTFQAIVGQPTFYVSGLEFSPIPIPGAVWLFGSGIAGIAVLTRRRRKNQSAIAA